MDFQEMMKKSRERLLSENKQLKTACNEKVRDIKDEIKDLEEENQSLKNQRETLGFFQMKRKKELDTILGKYACRIDELRREKDQLIADTDSQIQQNNKKLAIIDGKKGEIVEFGSAPYSYGREPLRWAIISCDNQKMRLICMNTVGLLSYGRATKWLCTEFLNEAFSDDERLAIDPDVSVPTGDEATVKGNKHVTPTNALREYVIAEQQEAGRRYMYNSLQIQNGIKSELERCEPYWLVTHNTRDGFANYVGRGWEGEWICARIGSGASFGVRPVITVDRFEALNH